MFRKPRQSQVDLTALLQQQNPRIDLRIDAYEASIRTFIKDVTKFKNGVITVITERRNAQAAEIKRAMEKLQLVESETNQCKLIELEMLESIEKEKDERKDAEMLINGLRRQLASAQAKGKEVTEDIEQHRRITDSFQKERAEEKEKLEKGAEHAARQLQCYENSLQCVVEGIGKDQLLIRYMHIDPLDVHREFTVVLDVSDRIYKVLTATPLLPHLPILLDELNQSRDIYRFMRRVREAFVEQVGSGQAAT